MKTCLILMSAALSFSIGCGSPFEAASSRGPMDPPIHQTGTSQDDAGDPSSANPEGSSALADANEASATSEAASSPPGDDAGDAGLADAAIPSEASTGTEGGTVACAPCDSTACESISGGTAAYDTCEATIYTCYANLDSKFCKDDAKGACQYTCTATEYSCQAACYTDAGGSLVGCIDTCATEATSCNGGC